MEGTVGLETCSVSKNDENTAGINSPEAISMVPRNCDENELQIKPQYMVARVRTLDIDLLSEKDKVKIEEFKEANQTQLNGAKDDAKTDEDKGNKKLPKWKKLKGQNKHRPPPMKVEINQRICPSLVDVGVDEDAKPCPYGANCQYKHDLKAYMEERKPDVLPEGCYNYRTLGRCPRGISCLFGSEHLTADGRNKINPNPIGAESTAYFNFLSKDLQKQLRKKQFNFDRAQKTADSFKTTKNVDESLSVVEPVAKKICLSENPIKVEVEDLSLLKPEEKKKIDWQGKLYLAPLTTVGNLPFRRVCKKLGADITCGEMAMADQLLDGGQMEWALTRKHSSEDIFGVQICGNNPYVLSKCGQLLDETTEIDFIDLNLGCPIDLVYQKGAGSGLMRRRGPLESSIRSLSQLLKIPFTVKMRMGVYTDQPMAHKLVEQCREWGVSMVTVHGRSREQRYTRLADWDYVKKCVAAASPMPIFGNGDIMSFEDYEKDIEQSGVAGVMIARGALIKPWIFTEIKERRHWDISSSERFQYMKDFVNYGLEHWGSDSQGVERTRRFLLEWQSFSHRYVPVGLLERPPQKLNLRPPPFCGRDDLETLLGSPNAGDWVRISEMLLGSVPEGFQFLPKHKANSWK